MSGRSIDIAQLYQGRFSREELQKKNEVWKVLCGSFFQKYVSEEQTVLDVGAGYCEFINHIRCAKKFAVDPNADAVRHAAPDVKVFAAPATDLSFLPEASVDTVFMSNLLEHMRSKEDVLKVLAEARRVLKSGQRVMILQPNVRFLCREYWDFFDHHIPLSDRSLAEALQLAGFQIEKIIPRFLPYTTKSRLPRGPVWVKMYLGMPWAWRIFGKQTFVVARKTCTL